MSVGSPRLVLAVCAAIGLSVGQNAWAETKEESDKMVRTYTVGRMVDGAFTPLGTAEFGDDNVATLTLSGSSPDHDALEKAWNKSVALEVLDIRRNEMFTDAKGKMVRGSVSVKVSKSEDGYPDALFDHLSVNGGYFGVERTE